MQKKLNDYLNIQKPVSTNRVPFYNITGMDRLLSREMVDLFSDRELTFGVLPEMEKRKKEYREILDRIGDPEKFDFQMALFGDFEVFDPPGVQSAWELTPFNSVIQGKEVSSPEGDKYTNCGTCLVEKKEVGSKVNKVKVVAKVASKGEVGVVFNFRNQNDFWIFSYANDIADPEVPNYVVVRRVLYGAVSEYGRGLPITDDLTNKIVRLVIDKDGDSLKARLKDEDGNELTDITIRNVGFLSQARCGLYSQNNADSEFFKLKIAYSNKQPDRVHTFKTELDRLGQDQYQRKFQVFNVDLRPMSWLATFKRLWAEKLFAKKKLQQAQTVYDSTLDTDDQDTNGAYVPPLSPELLDNVEGALRQAFDDYLVAEEKYQEFATFMSEAGVDIPAESSSDTVLSLFDTANTAAGSISRIKQAVTAFEYEAWKEFFVTCAVVTNPETVAKSLSKEERERVMKDGGDKAWNLHVKETLKNEKVKSLTLELPHYKFAFLEVGDQYETQEGIGFITSKYWKTDHTRKSFKRKNPDGSLVAFEIEISNVNEVAKAIREEVIGSEGSGVEAQKVLDLREYHSMNGLLVDQYGVTLQDHVIHLTENESDSVHHVLMIPLFDSASNIRPDRMLVVRNPIFSGKQLHPVSVKFNEQYGMDVRWGGIGLGEFSHSVNLFPGEEREMKIVTSKKRSFETVTKTKTSSKQSSASEATTASKRNDSFASKLTDSMETSNSFSRSSSTKTKASVSVSAKGGWGPFSASASASYGRDTSEESSSKLSSVAKRSSDLASKSSNEVSDNNKVSFNSTTETESSLETKVAGEDMETETTVIKLYNINEGKTANFNFFQVTNNYHTALSLENVTLNVDTGIEIIPGTGLTIAREIDLEKFTELPSEFTIYQAAEQKDLFKIIAAQVLLRYVNLGEEPDQDDPWILQVEQGRWSTLQTLKQDCDEAIKNPEADENGTQLELVDRLPDGLLELENVDFTITPMAVGEESHYTINSGKYFVDAHLGISPATEPYLETRRDIETERQKALVNELRVRTRKGIFFPEYPENIQSLSFDGENLNGEAKPVKPKASKS